MLKAAIVGASGYAGQQLAQILLRHPEIELDALYVSENSSDAGRPLSAICGALDRRCSLSLQQLPAAAVRENASGIDMVFIATDHKTAHDITPLFLEGGAVVFDLSGAHRFPLPRLEMYEKYYGFSHQHPELLKEAVYGLCEWCQADKLKKARLFSMPGCYATTSELALIPLTRRGLLDPGMRPVISAVSGVSGAGRKASLTSSFCEVSLNAYGLFTHRHQPEISLYSAVEVVFNPILGCFKRGIYATITCKLAAGADLEAVRQAYIGAYQDKPLVRFHEQGIVKLDDVVGLPCCDISVAADDDYLVICSTLDNLLKGAAAQAVQACNLHYGFREDLALW